MSATRGRRPSGRRPRRRLGPWNRWRPCSQKPTTADNGILNFLPYTVSRWNDGRGSLVQEYWRVTGLEHAWSGGSAAGSYSDPRGPDATSAMWALFTHHAAREQRRPHPTADVAALYSSRLHGPWTGMWLVAAVVGKYRHSPIERILRWD